MINPPSCLSKKFLIINWKLLFHKRDIFDRQGMNLQFCPKRDRLSELCPVNIGFQLFFYWSGVINSRSFPWKVLNRSLMTLKGRGLRPPLTPQSAMYRSHHFWYPRVICWRPRTGFCWSYRQMDPGSQVSMVTSSSAFLRFRPSSKF